MRKILGLILGIFLTIVSFGKTIEGKVVKVADGDTITILEKGKKVKIRFYGIDAPEKKQEYGVKSLSVLKDLLDNEIVKVQVKR